jgi:uncharacterized Ntn-hydrolase superfamily protein
MNKICTFSIVANSPKEEAWGIAVASKFPAVGAVVPWARAGAGAVATQSYANTTFGPQGLELMEDGYSAQATLEKLLAEDDQRDQRQVGLVDANGMAATYTGENCLPWAGGEVGENFAIQGNILTGPETVQAMVDAFQKSMGDLPDRLYAALLAGDRAGGDRRGKQSAAILVVKEKAGYGGYNDRWLDYRVDDHEDPVPHLAKLIQMHRLYFGSSEKETRIKLSGENLKTLQSIAQKLGYYKGKIHGKYDESTQAALRSFLGNENFEERTDFEKGEIDEPVLAFLLEKFDR